MAITLTITINSQELVDAFIAWNSERNSQEGTSLTPQQRVKLVLTGIAKTRLGKAFADQRRNAASTVVEAEIEAEEARLEGLT
jgi:hypothetical protein